MASTRRHLEFIKSSHTYFDWRFRLYCCVLNMLLLFVSLYIICFNSFLCVYIFMCMESKSWCPETVPHDVTKLIKLPPDVAECIRQLCCPLTFAETQYASRTHYDTQPSYICCTSEFIYSLHKKKLSFFFLSIEASNCV